MDAALLIARLLLAGVFALAGVAKLSDLAGSRKAIIDFGLPAVLASPLAPLLPLAELAVAAALIPASTAWWGALGLLLLFVVGISINLARGRKPRHRDEKDDGAGRRRNDSPQQSIEPGRGWRPGRGRPRPGASPSPSAGPVSAARSVSAGSGGAAGSATRT